MGADGTLTVDAPTVPELDETVNRETERWVWVLTIPGESLVRTRVWDTVEDAVRGFYPEFRMGMWDGFFTKFDRPPGTVKLSEWRKLATWKPIEEPGMPLGRYLELPVITSGGVPGFVRFAFFPTKVEVAK